MMRKETSIVLGTLLAGLAVSAWIWYIQRGTFEYLHPERFWALLALPAIAGVYFWQVGRRTGTVRNGAFALLATLPESWMGYGRHTLMALRMVGLTYLVLCIARPQSAESKKNITSEGIDIVLTMDVSTSMLARDFKPDRLNSAKRVAQAFMEGRNNDRLGVVVYEGESFTQVPLTTDHRVVRTALENLEAGIIEGGTAIGMGLATAVNRLKDSEAESKVVILLTDGENNAGQIKPIDAARIAQAFDIRVYTIGVGGRGKAPYPQFNPFINREEIVYIDSKIDEETLEEMAELTGGRYFRATSENKLRDIYGEIDRLEKTQFNVTQYSEKTEEFAPFALMALMVLGAEFLLRLFVFRFTA